MNFLNDKKKPRSMRRSLVMLLITMVVLQVIVLITVLIHRDFYAHVDSQSIDMFYTRSNQQVEVVNKQISDIVKTVVQSSKNVTSIYSAECAVLETQLSLADLTDAKYQNAHVNTASVLLNLLTECKIDSAFYIITGEDGKTTTVNIGNIYPELSNDGYLAYELVTGSSLISKTYELGINAKWDLIIDPYELEREYFLNPLDQLASTTLGDIEKYGFWQMPTSEQDQGQIIYSVPLINELGKGYGVLGIGISEKYFQENYLKRTNFSFEDSFYLIGKYTNDSIIIDEYLPNEYEEIVTLSEDISVIPENVPGFNIYGAELIENQEAILKFDDITMYSSISPFNEDKYSYITIVPKEQLYVYSDEIKEILTLSIACSLIFSLIMSIFYGNAATRSVYKLVHSVRNMSSNDEMNFPKTNFVEINDLTDAISKLNQKIEKSTKTLNNLFEITQLNLGGFEITPSENSVQITEYICELLQIPKTDRITIEEWQEKYKRLVKKVIDNDNNIYIYWIGEERKYLKIIQVSTAESVIGTVLDVTKEIEEVMETKYLLDYDALTKLYSRSAYYREAKSLIEANPEKIGAVVFIDLDNLKFVNDTFGHDYGDLYLTTASKIFSEIASLGGIAGRMSGDEFAVYMHNFDSKESLLEIVKNKMAEHRNLAINLPDGTTQKVRFSSGVAWYSSDSDDISELVKFADFAMYEAKHTEKGTLRLFDRESYNEKIYMMENREAINQLIEEQQVEFMLQPVVSLHTGETVAYEALMRSKMEMFKSPLEILKVAASQFKLNELEHMVVKKAVADVYERRNELGDAQIYINSITSQILPVEIFEELSEKYGDFIKRIVIEITEAEDNTPEKMRQKVSIIKEYGMQIAIDDFGSGYSNELRIIAINPDVVKIDMKLLNGISLDKDKQLLCQNIINYSHSKNILIVAEGIEHYEDLEKICELGADCVQGFYVAKPSFGVSQISKERHNEILQLNQKNKALEN